MGFPITDPDRVTRYSNSRSARGLLLRGVIEQVYLYDEGDDQAGSAVQRPTRSSPTGEKATAMFADVFVYSSVPNAPTGIIPRVLITHGNSGIHDGDIRVPRGIRIPVGAVTRQQVQSNVSPADLSGEHVLVGFMDNSLLQPVVVAWLPHPRSDLGKNASTTDLGARLRPVSDDKNPRLWRHQGAYWGVDADGNFIFDGQQAHRGYQGDGVAANGGGYDTQGHEVASTQVDGAGKARSGNQVVRLPANAALTIEWANGEKIELTSHDGKLVISASAETDIQSGIVKVGAGATQPAVKGTQWQANHANYDRDLLVILSALVTQVIAAAGSTAANATQTINAVTAALTAPPVSTALVALSTYMANTNNLSTSVTVKD